jgi:hypothetical protein
LWPNADICDAIRQPRGIVNLLRPIAKGARLMMTTDTPRFPWTGIDAAEWLRTWQSVWRGAPDNLVQPILPGWTFNINSHNSSAPQTEVDVVAKHGYGRQLGRMADVLELLTMKHDIDNVKQDAAAARISRITKDLALLKAQDEAQYVRLRDALREALT